MSGDLLEKVYVNFKTLLIIFVIFIIRIYYIYITTTEIINVITVEDNSKVYIYIIIIEILEVAKLKIWGKLVKDNKIIKDEVVVLEDITDSINDDDEENLKLCVNQLCDSFDISKPYWLDANRREYCRRSKVTFNNNNFIEEIDFDRFIIEKLEEKM